ncbi:iron-containing alcohol dehydrogenase [Veronia pacifica]|uniref:Aldehyde reductase n=1 Tax=Veronia pacifica TaxID=1080227 RepID=A0A1C3ES43_9GAMM|nr:iron-containing alcohol dehydrogenase [Veronia pacifica]ODA36087.1 aldehyde reductase [Veronia pacifica]
MNNFEFFNPTRIVFGEGEISRLSSLVPEKARVLVLFGGESARKFGTLDEVKAALGDRHVSFFGGVEANPKYETLLNAIAQVKDENIDFLIAVGGGSVIDGTKFVAAASRYPSEPMQMLKKAGSDLKEAIPFGAVLTLSATGSEMNKISVITYAAAKAKMAFFSETVFPQFSILDPVKTFTLPPRQIGNGIVDAFIHVTEQYLTYPVNAKIQDRFAEGILQTLVEEGPKTVEQPDNYEVRSNLMWAASQALNGLIGVGVPHDWATHMIGHELTALYGLDHAQTLAVVLPSLLEEKQQQKQSKLAQFAERVWGVQQGSEAEKAAQAISLTREFFESVGVKTRLSDYQLDETCIDPLIKHLSDHGMTRLGEHRDIDLDACRRILQRSL